MTTLADVNNSIQAMVDQQESTNDSLQSLVSKIAAEGEASERQRLKDSTAKRASSSKPKAAPPKSFIGGLAQGTGLSGLSGILGSMLKGIGFGGGLLGGATLGGLFGRAVGRLFFPAVGAFFGIKYLDKWIDPLMDKMLGDDATWTMFGKEIDASKIVSGFAGALGIILGPKLIKGAVFSLFQKDAITKGPALRQKFLRRLGLSSILLAAGGFAGEWLENKGAPEGMANAVGAGLTGAGIGYQFFGVKGMIIGAIAGIAYEGLKQLTIYLNSKRKELVMDHLNEAVAELDAVDTSEGIDRAQAMLDAKAAITRAEKAAASITNVKERAAAEEASRMLRLSHRARLAKEARNEAANAPVGQRLLGKELEDARASESVEGSVSADSMIAYLKGSVDLTPDQIKGLDEDTYRGILESYLADAPFQGLQTPEAVKTAVDTIVSLPAPFGGEPVPEPETNKLVPLVDKPKTQVRARVSSMRSNNPDIGINIQPGYEENALDAFSVDNPMALPLSKIDVSPKAPSDLVNPNTAALMSGDYKAEVGRGGAGGFVDQRVSNTTNVGGSTHGIILPPAGTNDPLDAGAR
jgi:hypothetical protein